MPEGYDSEIFKTYYLLEAERARFEDMLNVPREFDDPKVEEAFYENEVSNYVSRIREIID